MERVSNRRARPLPAPPLDVFKEVIDPRGKKEVSPTMEFEAPQSVPHK